MSLVETPFALARSIVEALPEAACLCLTGSDLLFPNQLWREQAGKMSRLAHFERLGIDPRDLAERMADASSPNGSPTFDLALDPGGTRRLLGSVVRDQEGLFLFMIRDERETRRVEQMRKDFIANVSHELRTPLTAVRGYVETLMDPNYLTLEHVQQFMPVIFEHTERLHNLMLDLLSLSRLESADTRIELTPLSLADELQDAVEATASLAALKKVHIDLKPPDDAIKALANPEHLERVLVNLLDNAIKYSSPDDRVSIWTEHDGEFVWTHVRDEGAGIGPDELPRVFERFYRTKGAVSGRVRGSGLGLAIVKHIVQQFDGEVRVSSEVGKGSDFYFSLRLAGE